jgi:hypothetical protein
MKRLLFALSLVTVVFAGCSSDSLTGPDGDRGIEPSGTCDLSNMSAC